MERRLVIDPMVTVCRPLASTLTINSVAPVARVLSDPYGWFNDEVVVDLSAVRFAPPAGLVAVVGAVAAAAGYGTQVRVVCPTDGGCCSYLASSGVLQYWKRTGVVLDGSGGVEGRSPSASPTILALTTVVTDGDAGDVRQRVGDVLERLLGSGDEAWRRRRQSFRGAVHEMSTNVVRHTRATGFVLAQKYYNRRERRYFVEFAVGDAGPGIPVTLRGGVGGLDDLADEVVLGRMVREGLSSRGGGMGYETVVQFTSAHDGQFDLRSGAASLSISRGGGEPKTTALGWSWPGTVLSGSVTCPA